MKRFLFLLLALVGLNVMAQDKPIQCDSVIQAEGKMYQSCIRRLEHGRR